MERLVKSSEGRGIVAIESRRPEPMPAGLRTGEIR
jgi:hypothetical protein